MPWLQLDRFADALDRVAAEMPDLRRELNTQLAEMIKEEVDRAIVSSGINDSHGHVRSWQITEVGSGGGYGAVHPDGAINLFRYAESDYNSYTAITRFLDHGRIRHYPKKVKSRRHRETSIDDFIIGGWVDGKHFYRRARTVAKSRAIEIAQQAAEEIAKKLEV